MYLSSLITNKNNSSDILSYLKKYIFYTHQEGVLFYLPLGNLIYSKIISLIKDKMKKINCYEICMPSFIDEENIPISKRVKGGFLKTMGIYFSHDNKSKYMLPTHEEIITHFINNIDSKIENTKSFFQISRKYRSEKDTRYPVRLNEFFMKDGYSFSPTKEDLDSYYESVKLMYIELFNELDLEFYLTPPSRDLLFKDVSQEFIANDINGNEIFFIKEDKEKFAIKKEDSNIYEKEFSGLEIAHIYKLYDMYSNLLNNKLQMGSYGIGIERIIYSIISQKFKNGIINWPNSVRPFKISIISENTQLTNDIYRKLNNDISCYIDDLDTSIEQKIKTSKELGVENYILLKNEEINIYDNNENKIKTFKNNQLNEILNFFNGEII